MTGPRGAGVGALGVTGWCWEEPPPVPPSFVSRLGDHTNPPMYDWLINLVNLEMRWEGGRERREERREGLEERGERQRDKKREKRE